MPKEKILNVTMRVRIGESEIEVTGPSAFVEKKIAEFVERQKPGSISSSPIRKKDMTSSGTEAAQTFGKGMSVAQFFKKLSLKTDLDRVLAAGYFLEKFKNQDSFTASEVKDTIRGAKISPPINPSESISRNIKKGYIMPSGDKEGKMAFVLTSDGEETITELLNA
ncbi:MAG: hypothetical protein WCO26_03065 [Deltaproteobacteria bacterium]